MAKKVKTNAMRILETAGIPFRVIEYDVDEDDLSGIHVARICNLPVEQVFKTLVAKGDQTGFIVACVPVHMSLNMKAIASVSGNKKVDMLLMKDLFPVTGYIRGGCSPIGMKKIFPVFFEETAQLYEWIAVSAGVRGAQIVVASDDLIGYVNGSYADIAEEAMDESKFNGKNTLYR